MNAQSSSDRRGVLAVGTLLVLAGIAAIVLRQAGFDLDNELFETGWPLFVIVPGLALLTASVFPAPPRGVGFAIAGSIVTSVGLLLFYQQSSGHWESWSYAWTLIGPGAAGLGLLGYGLLFRVRDFMTTGAWLVTISAVLFVVGFWFFETIFESGRVPVDLDAWWPVGLIGLGVAVLVGGMFESTRRHHV
jgi:hypothetical protein